MDTGKGRKILTVLVAAAVMLTAAGGAAPQTPEPDVGEFPLWLLEEPAERGELVPLDYESAAGKGTPAQAWAYVPYGYDPAERYDVLFLWPGTRGGGKIVFETEHKCRMEDKQREVLTGARVLDRLIEEGRIRPLIVICAEEITHGKLPIARQDFQTVWELAAENFSLYAADESLSPEERREHAAFLGFSQGAVYTQTLAMTDHFGDMAHFAAVCYGSRSTTGARAVNDSELPLETVYFLVGNEQDGGADSGYRAYRDIVWRCREKVSAEENAFFRRSRYYAHNYALVLAAFVDMLPRAFPGEAAGE